MLPLELPEVDDYSPTTFDPEDADTDPSPPLSRATEWVDVELDLGDGQGRKHYRRDTNTMPNWAGSCWYQLRYVDPTNSERFVAEENERYWLGPRTEAFGPQDPGGVDLYIGGVEHAVLHLLYSRFWQKVLFDLGHVSSDEPYRKLFNQGYIQAYAYTDARGQFVPAGEVVEENGKFFYEGQPVTQSYGKMGKTERNVVTPDEMCESYGADTFRLYEMSMGPMEVSRPWATKDVVGAHRFLQRLWRNVVDETDGSVRITGDAPTEEDLRQLNRAIAGVREDYAAMRFNTAGAKLIELNNHVTKTYSSTAGTPRALAEPLALMLSPLAPHVAEELWSRLGHTGSVAHAPFPVADPALVQDEAVICVVQIKGKVKARLSVSPAIPGADLEALALADPAVVAALGDAVVRKVVVRAPKLVNIVV
jgi:leucyl-tRNA synthetase